MSTKKLYAKLVLHMPNGKVQEINNVSGLCAIILLSHGTKEEESGSIVFVADKNSGAAQLDKMESRIDRLRHEMAQAAATSPDVVELINKLTSDLNKNVKSSKKPASKTNRSKSKK